MSLSSVVSPILAQQSGPSGGMGQIIFLVLMFAAMYFLMIAPQRKKQKEHAKMLESLSTGDEVITGGGIYGEITNKKDDRYVIRIAEGTKIEVGKAFIHALVKKAG
ncbi:preprotein translocase subunit YajC [Rariglobus hedericola]|uniref:Sec translocon accessory complex subunit YajC n=1 Tax=Rariglobus hedericola TaxID=2597822 RepID=A0A556QNJ3_9BACT|nr:preprotein translocase subunit YajC [Rariglobus hedericola]TSJ78199.1 preprotein translocase subunit YajC [Rariglobus hedericola]